ncbi:TPA: UDP-glucose 4-epimerase GalE [candidate division WWE3 bacterium]|uniref:UDP-glucose 4-epimerase n=1 Tax=candidate division WWE3 bacterium TaxID=2053526 RepID=A0A351JS84_UNCKA|nr:UDP-glucose 4-epimerase [candidate division WWE3 bacterium RAAC2_WWE3_1]KKS29284.1 MAG: UDP-glucose 4-epimerase [candidate division WWE3 bacterium GW2011_GWB1_42_117]KKS54577.1 MAG: UDP-glucose 4-epimerase [candidate division WWE3 bacterium GW2011_GWD2_42_34]KKT05342.1 MAG: UDP-glucose 4-epimerase [candidate division WWE3 bacterium GW2011_GWE2_43_18]KKT06557.1 MAG: UDP-glucose 4-epimerase [candidate division WWE3 bacterium GW2011_GWF2_43_18]KKT08268.1 MAG: UDP-glucose 4-epimerase [candidate
MFSGIKRTPPETGRIMKSEILVTGGAGYIGSHAVKRLLKENYKVRVLDNFTTGRRQALENLKKYGNLEVLEVDLRDGEKVKSTLNAVSKNNVSAVMHFAGVLSVGESMQDPHKYFLNNLMGSVNLLEAMRIAGIKNIIFSSTCATYGNSRYLPIDEKHPQNPTNPYGESKLMVEKAIRWYSELFGLRHVIFRYFNVFGSDPDCDVGYSSLPPVHLVQSAVRGALGLSPFSVTCADNFDTRDGTPVRDYVDVVDLVDAHFRAVKYLEGGGTSDVFNLGTGKGFTVYEIIDQVEKTVGNKFDRNPGEIRRGEYAEVYANYDKAKAVLGWNPSTSLEEGINNLTRWFKKYPEGLEN